jgi:hypothetical protein
MDQQCNEKQAGGEIDRGVRDQVAPFERGFRRRQQRDTEAGHEQKERHVQRADPLPDPRPEPMTPSAHRRRLMAGTSAAMNRARMPPASTIHALTSGRCFRSMPSIEIDEQVAQAGEEVVYEQPDCEQHQRGPAEASPCNRLGDPKS